MTDPLIRPGSDATSTGYVIAAEWGIGKPLESLAFIVPVKLACAMFNGCFNHLMVCGRHMANQNRLFLAWFPTDFKSKKRKVNFHQPAELTYESALLAMDELHKDLIKWRLFGEDRYRIEKALCPRRIEKHYIQNRTVYRKTVLRNISGFPASCRWPLMFRLQVVHR